VSTRATGTIHTGLDFRCNRLLACCPQESIRELSNYFSAETVHTGEILYELGSPPTFVHFPVTYTVSLINALPSGHTAQIAVIGCEGAIGIGAVLGGGAMATRALVQTGGEGVRVEALRVRDEFERGGVLNRLLVRYTQCLIAQMSQTSICSKHHTPEQQLCRWLLLTLDRICSSDLEITHEMIGTILGLRRETVTETMHKLEERQLIVARRKHLQVPNRAALEAAACGCYRVIHDEYASLLPSWSPVDC
jgi:CRP-like cAMP-binding protein